MRCGIEYLEAREPFVLVAEALHDMTTSAARIRTIDREQSTRTRQGLALQNVDHDFAFRFCRERDDILILTVDENCVDDV